MINSIAVMYFINLCRVGGCIASLSSFVVDVAERRGVCCALPLSFVVDVAEWRHGQGTGERAGQSSRLACGVWKDTCDAGVDWRACCASVPLLSGFAGRYVV